LERKLGELTETISLDEYEVNKVVDMFIGERWIEVSD
jgi:hypothetical protein